MDCLPVLPVLESKDKLHSAVFHSLERHFKTKYDYLPHFYVRVPGRVNLIGEYIDYNGFSVLPMAIELEVMLAVGICDTKTLSLSNVDGDKYEDFSVPLDCLIIDKIKPKWYHYFLCGMKGVIEDCQLSPKGIDVAVKTTIPTSSGLSSALVCAAALVTCYSNRIAMSQFRLASLCAESKHYIETERESVDQAIAFLAKTGAAKFIEYESLQIKDVFLPAEAVFVVANSCVPMKNEETYLYSTRVVECKLAAKLLAKGYSLNLSSVEKLSDISDQISTPLRSLPEKIKNFLHEEPYTRKEICQLLEIDENYLESEYLNDNTKHLKEFKLYQRAAHVFAEAYRVLLFKDVCESNSTDTLEKLGRLMIESHISCRDLYECSHPDIDEFIEIAVNGGAIGAKLAGAGWEGWCVVLVRSEILVSFLEEIKYKYFFRFPHRSKDWQSCIFTSRPGNGAVVHIA